MALKIRRGTESQRGQFTYAAGEIIWTTNGHKLFVGDGLTPGGIDIASQLAGVGLHFNATTGRLDIDFNGTTTDTLTEGQNRLYFTAARAESAVGSALIAGNPHNTGITFTYDDVNHWYTASVSASAGLPNQTGNGGKFLTTNGSGTLSWAAGSVVTDTAPTLGGNLTLGGHDITGTGNVNVTGTIAATSGLGANLPLNNHSITGTGNIAITGGAVFESNLGGAASTDFLTIRTHHSDVDAAGAFFYRSKGTSGSPTALTNGDAIFNLAFSGRSSNSTDGVAAAIGSEVGGTVGAGIVPGKLVFYTTSTAGSLSPALTIDSLQTSTFNGRIQAINGNAVNPSITFTTDGGLDSGLFHPADGIVCVSINAVETVRVDSGGMRVEGFMKVANANGTLPSPPEAGMIVLDGSTFKGYNGSAWVTLG